MKSYRFTVPPTAEVGSYSGACRSAYGETYRQHALSDYNSCRAHDGLPPVARMPRGTKYTPLALCPVTSIRNPRVPVNLEASK